MTKKQKKILYRILISFVLTVIVSFLPFEGIIKGIIYLIPYFLVGYDILHKALKGIISLQPFDENFLMAIATVGAFILGEYAEAVLVVLFYQTGELFQGYAVGKSRKSISSLMDIRPDYANTEDENGNLIKTDPYEISVGDHIFVKPGEKIALDGIVVEGESYVNTVALTGESMPAYVKMGDEVLSGCVNTSGLIKVRVTKEFDQSTASKILDMVENATSKKAKTERFISKFARYYTPAVCICALLLGVLPPLISYIFWGNSTFGIWIYRALTFLVISCPCALVISVPLAFFAAIGGLSRRGVLVKGANCLETLAKVNIFLFDKTGTLTKGSFEPTGFFCNGVSKEELTEYGALIEWYSTHPLSESLKKSYEKPLDKSRVSCFTEMKGLGVSAKIDGKVCFAGNDKLMNAQGIEFTESETLGTVVHIAADGKYLGHIVLADKVKNSSAEAVKALKKAGVKKCFMLTGDLRPIAEEVAEKIGIDTVYSQLLPDEKAMVAEKVISEKLKNDRVAFVGDGINDAPVLALSDIGIAMGGLGSDAAIEAADTVIMDDDPIKLLIAVKGARKCMSVVWQNIYFSIAVKLVFLGLGAFGLVNMWLAIFADVGVMVLAVINSVRALRI